MTKRSFVIMIVFALICSNSFMSVISTDIYAGSIREKGKSISKHTKEAARKGKAIVYDKAKSATESGKAIAEKGKKLAIEKGEVVKSKIKLFYSNIDKEDFKRGWENAVDIASAEVAAKNSSKYVDSVRRAIEKFGASVNESKGSARTVAQEAGYVAEKWTAETFNIDAIARGSSSFAETPGSNKFASPDVVTNYGEEASLKFYKTASESASEQAKTVIEKYNEYKHTTKKPVSKKDYLDKYGFDEKMQDLCEGVYKGQTRIIPADQYKDAVEYLKGRAEKLSFQSGKKAEVLTNTYKETIDSLSDRLEDPKGTQSKPATKKEIEAVAELAKNGDFKPEDFGFKVSQIITPKYIVKQAINTGEKSATINMAIKLGPELYLNVVKAAKDGEIDETALKKMGVDALTSGSEGFIEGSVSSAILIACQSGKLGSAFVNASPDAIGALTVLAIDSMRYGYALSKGDITAVQFGDLMAEEIVTSSGAMAAGAGVSLFFGGSAIVGMAGCLAGSMLASMGYNTGKQAVLEIRDAGGFAAIVPTDAIKGVLIDKTVVAKLKLDKAKTFLEGMKVSTSKDGRIAVFSTGRDAPF